MPLSVLAGHTLGPAVRAYTHEFTALSGMPVTNTNRISFTIGGNFTTGTSGLFNITILGSPSTMTISTFGNTSITLYTGQNGTGTPLNISGASTFVLAIGVYQSMYVTASANGTIFFAQFSGMNISLD